MKKEDAYGHVLDALAFGPTGAIKRQEAMEQQRACGGGGQIVSIARDFGYGEGAGRKLAALKAAGVVFLEENEKKSEDKVLQKVRLPDGWKLVPTDHHMWSDLVDEHGNKRAFCGYKGAFYDRWASITVLTRYHTDMEYGKYPQTGPGPTSALVKDTKTGTVLFQTPFETLAYDDDSQREAAVAWLNEHYPDWTNPNAYWGPSPASGEEG